jgi:hypothetical protein
MGTCQNGGAEAEERTRENKKMPALPPENAGIIERLFEAALPFSPPPSRFREMWFGSATPKQESVFPMHEGGHIRLRLFSAISKSVILKKFQKLKSSYKKQLRATFESESTQASTH